MKDNTVAKVILWIGGLTIGTGVIGSFIGGLILEDFVIMIVGVLSCVIFGVLLIGFSEVINLS